MNDRVSLTTRDGVAQVRLNRPEKMNALDPAMFAALADVGNALRSDESLRAVVLSGAGRAFCAGLDMQSFGRMQAGGGIGGESGGPFAPSLLTRTHGIANVAQQVAMLWRDLPVPVIAAVHGAAFGGGLQIALGADVRIIAPDARMSVMEIKWGLVPDMAGILLMREVARADVVRELTFSGRLFDGEEACRLGFATQVVADPLAAALGLAAAIARQSPDAIRAAKRLLNMPQGDAAAVLLAESQEQEKLMGSANQVEAIRANLERRLPVFR
jgi:enoyl-CoA hydratase/carnithine racemase